MTINLYLKMQIPGIILPTQVTVDRMKENGLKLAPGKVYIEY